MELIETIPGKTWSRVHPRYKEHTGDIVDLGCLDWDWSQHFLREGGKRVIGVDPQEHIKPSGALLYRGVVGPFSGLVKLDTSHATSHSLSLNDARESKSYVEMLSWKDFCAFYKITSVSILKINIEGAEYPLLASMNASDFDNIDQIAISLHDWMTTDQHFQAVATRTLLDENGYELTRTHPGLGWILATKIK